MKHIIYNSMHHIKCPIIYHSIYHIISNTITYIISYCRFLGCLPSWSCKVILLSQFLYLWAKGTLYTKIQLHFELIFFGGSLHFRPLLFCIPKFSFLPVLEPIEKLVTYIHMHIRTHIRTTHAHTLHHYTDW